MKRLLVYILAFGLALSLPIQARSDSDSFDSYDQALGICAADSMDTGISMSMMGWGLAIIVGITILAIVIHQSAGGNVHSSSSSGGTSTSNTGIGSLI